MAKQNYIRNQLYKKFNLHKLKGILHEKSEVNKENWSTKNLKTVVYKSAKKKRRRLTRRAILLKTARHLAGAPSLRAGSATAQILPLQRFSPQVRLCHRIRVSIIITISIISGHILEIRAITHPDRGLQILRED